MLLVWQSRASIGVRAALVALHLATGAVAPASAASPAEDAAFLDALTWGITGSSFTELREKGRDRWLREQLHPPLEPRLPPDAARQIAALRPQEPLVERVRALELQAKAASAEPDPEAKKIAQQAYQSSLNAAARDAAAATLLRFLYSSDQVRERLTWFWFNRFNVHQGKANLRGWIDDYIDTAIRPHALGHFRDLLAATLRHPAMLRYLDNAENSVGHLNENYAREIMELHTMGVGSGYTQGDVEALARILTGVGVETRAEDPKLKPERKADLIRDGLFIFNPNRHDYGDKLFLGHVIRGRGFGEVEEALDILGHHPATARNVSAALATYFTGTEPSEAQRQRLAAVFTRSDGDIAAVMEALIRSPDLTAGLSTQIKDPIRYLLSALRLAYDGRVILNTGPIQNWLNRLGEGLFNRSTPDGYPLLPASWTGPGQMTTRFEIARQIGAGPAGLFRPPGADAVEEPAFPLLLNALYFSTLVTTLSEPTRAVLARAVSPQDWNTLFLSSPEFMR
ncbi:DUF1800 domain-containing protein [Methylorubrum zatmanii]|uniref:DUF1800 domain-containing protein n=1 Tax=Methylorubrum zatmanii TaxID=29429 RepID=A0ABW1WRI1_9HYPH|nr:DUF1800 domain-containing protein [Methylorubrum zatmanii]MBD8906172.1 hypothetical protein [Methylorubrum zatmanii]